MQLPVHTGANVAPANTARMIMYLDKQCNGTAAVAGDIMEQANWQSFRNLANSGRFTILMDKMVNLTPTNLTYDGTNFDASDVFMDGQFHKKCNIPIEYSGTTGAIGEIRSNNIGLLVFSRQNNALRLDSEVRLRFDD